MKKPLVAVTFGDASGIGPELVAKLLLRPGQKVLDIGSGWGGLALYLASECGADVTGLTL